MERYYGSFQRTFRVPANIKADKIDAAFDKGVLKVTLPKTEAAKKKEIAIKVKCADAGLPRAIPGAPAMLR